MDDPADADASGDEDLGPSGAPISDEAAELESGPLRPPRPEQREWKPPAGWAEPVEWRAPAEWTGASPIITEAAPSREPSPRLSLGARPPRTWNTDLPKRPARAMCRRPTSARRSRIERARGRDLHRTKASPPCRSRRTRIVPGRRTSSSNPTSRPTDSSGRSMTEAPRGSDPATPRRRRPLVTAMETPAATDLGGSAPHWHEQPEPAVPRLAERQRDPTRAPTVGDTSPRDQRAGADPTSASEMPIRTTHDRRG